jgi:hypothetical protein
MWTYKVATGAISRGNFIGMGYSGNGEGKNNPAMEGVPDVGPIPRGSWTIEGPPANTSEHGPFVLRLAAKDGTSTLGRDGFLIHGDAVAAPGTASKGCVIQGRTTREMIWNSGDYDLEVI